jgi:hypothetical protein
MSPTFQLLVLILSTTLMHAADTESIAFPKSSLVVDVTKAPYNAKGDDTTDDTAAVQKALDDTMGLHKIVYFPNGTYLVSETLRFTNKKKDGSYAYGFNWLQGQSTSCGAATSRAPP